MRWRGAASSLVGVGLALTSSVPALAQEETESPADQAPVRVSSMLVGHAGIGAVPFAESCPFAGAACEPGEVILDFGMDALGRIDDFAFGAGFSFGLGLKGTEAVGLESLERRHERSYLTLQGQFRYYLPPWGDFEWWVAVVGGFVVINDTWSTLADREPVSDVALIGPTALSISTEGATAGLGLGGQWVFWEWLLIGTQIRYSNWLLPTERELSPLGDAASLAGRVDVIDAHILLGFDIPL